MYRFAIPFERKEFRTIKYTGFGNEFLPRNRNRHRRTNRFAVAGKRAARIGNETPETVAFFPTRSMGTPSPKDSTPN